MSKMKGRKSCVRSAVEPVKALKRTLSGELPWRGRCSALWKVVFVGADRFQLLHFKSAEIFAHGPQSLSHACHLIPSCAQRSKISPEPNAGRLK